MMNQGMHCQYIAVKTETANLTYARSGGNGFLSEVFPCMYVAKMDFHRRDLNCL
jgi:hypothetical protein